VIRLLAVVLTLSACISQAKQAIAPEPDGTGTLSCKEIVEQCDSQCSDPLCLTRCSNQGTSDGAAQHGALIDCGQRNGCTDQTCMEASCSTEIQTCMGEPAPADGAPDAAPGEPPPGGEPPAPSDTGAPANAPGT
jgi:hypothetical protein